jgi:hypothetical protein
MSIHRTEYFENECNQGILCRRRHVLQPQQFPVREGVSEERNKVRNMTGREAMSFADNPAMLSKLRNGVERVKPGKPVKPVKQLKPVKGKAGLKPWVFFGFYSRWLKPTVIDAPCPMTKAFLPVG